MNRVKEKMGSWLIRIAFVAFVWLFIMPLSQAEAHSTLIEMSPAEHAVTDQVPKHVTLHFNEPVDINFAQVYLYDWNGKPVYAGKPKGEGRSAILKYVLPELKEGTYTVKWNVVSLDGHPVEGSYTFSVGKETEGGAKSVSDSGNAPITLIVARSIAQGVIMVAGGLYLFAFFAGRKQFPNIGVLLSKKRLAVIPLLVVLAIAELFAYGFSLPNGMPETILTGGWQMLREFPFILMVLGEVAVLLLLLLPGMLSGWYISLWIVLAALPAFGGHVWGIHNPLLALVPRIVHQLSISIWLGALLYVILLLIYNKSSENNISLKIFRPFFFKTVLVASVLVILSGLVMTYMQTGFTAIFTGWMTWSSLLSGKVILTFVMLGFALYQTLRWKKTGAFQTIRLVRIEWVVGLVIIVLGVWMSQVAYPVPSNAYDETLKSGQAEANLHITDLRAGKQTMRLELPEVKGGSAEKVQVTMIMPLHNTTDGPFEAKAKDSNVYEVDLPFSMSGKWRIKVVAEYPDAKKQWEDELFIKGNGEN